MVNKKLALWLGIPIALIALAYFAWRPLLIAHVTPPLVFEVNPEAMPLDYAQVSSWAAHPEKNSAANVKPLNETDMGERYPAAAFYVHPTTYFAANEWNWKPDSETHAQQGIEHVLATQASVFADCCDVYAPFYRQAHMGSFGWEENDSGTQALDLAYDDVEQAFDHFLDVIGEDTPFFLASHSQGSALLQKLITERISGTDLRDRLIVGYIIGYWTSVEIQPKNFPDIPFCENESMTGCIVTWDSYDSGAEPPYFTVPHWVDGKWQRLGESQLVCVNPLSWQTNSETISKEQHTGAVEPVTAGGLLDIFLNRNPGYQYQDLGHLVPNATSATCGEDGKLLADTQVDNEFEASGHGDSGSYHAFDWNLFYMNIRANVAARLRSHFPSDV